MVALSAIKAANASLSPESKLPTAVFVGATSGIGLGAIQALLKSTSSPKLYIIGRSELKFAPTLANLQELNTSAKLIFIEAQVSFLKEVDRVCSHIKTQESAIDYLWLSQGGMSFNHEINSEGLNAWFATAYYSRILFMRELIPLLNKSSNGRIVSVLTAGHEGEIITSDFGLLDPGNVKFFPAMKQGVAMLSLSMRELARGNEGVGFLHTNPGMVNTDVHTRWADTLTGARTPFRWLLKGIIPIFHSLGWSWEDAGRVGFFEMTNGKYSITLGKNFFRLDPYGEEVGPSAILSKYEEDGTGNKVWEHSLDVFETVLGQK